MLVGSGTVKQRAGEGPCEPSMVFMIYLGCTCDSVNSICPRAVGLTDVKWVRR